MFPSIETLARAFHINATVAAFLLAELTEAGRLPGSIPLLWERPSVLSSPPWRSEPHMMPPMS